MREILFRGKRIDNGEWVYGYYARKGADKESFRHYICVSTFSSDYRSNYTYPFYLHDYEVDPSTVGQYTDLTDKNGKKIFEGDIVKDDWGKVYEVFFTTQSCSFMVKLEHAPNEYEKGNYRLGEAWCDTIRVIGNIHDNPELLQMEG